MKLHTKLDAISDRDRPEIVDPFADAAYVLPGKTVRVDGRIGRVESATRGGDAEVDFGAVRLHVGPPGDPMNGQPHEAGGRVTERVELTRLQVQVDLDIGTDESWVPLFEDS